MLWLIGDRNTTTDTETNIDTMTYIKTYTDTTTNTDTATKNDNKDLYQYPYCDQFRDWYRNQDGYRKG